MGFKVPNGKKQLHVLIDEKVYQELVRVAPHVYGKHRGALSALVEEALRWYLQYLQYRHTKAQNPTTISSVSSGAVGKINPPLSIRNEFNWFLHKLKEETGLIPFKITLRLARAIMVRAFTRCKDDRTQNRKLHNWYLMGFIKPYKGGAPVKPSNPKDWYKIEEIEIVARYGA